MNPEICANVSRAMLAGGFTDRIMAAGAELDRVKEFLLMLSGEREPVACPPKQAPCVFPVFPGLARRHRVYPN